MTRFRNRVDEILGPQTEPAIGVSYALRTAVAATLGYVLYRTCSAHVSMWAVVSAIVVIQPETRASVSNAALRVIANLVGVGVGIAITALGLDPLVGLIAGLLAVAWVCRRLAVDAAARTASVAITIVLLTDPTNVAGSSELRVIGVLAGCAIGLVVTLAAAALERGLRGQYGRWPW